MLSRTRASIQLGHVVAPVTLIIPIEKRAEEIPYDWVGWGRVFGVLAQIEATAGDAGIKLTERDLELIGAVVGGAAFVSKAKGD